MNLVGLPGTSGDKKAHLVNSATGALKALQGGFAATSAGNNGAINLWRNDSGYYVCQLMRFRRVLKLKSFATKKGAVSQFKTWLAQI